MGKVIKNENVVGKKSSWAALPFTTQPAEGVLTFRIFEVLEQISIGFEEHLTRADTYRHVVVRHNGRRAKCRVVAALKPARIAHYS